MAFRRRSPWHDVGSADSILIPFGRKQLRACLAFGLPINPNRIASWLRQPALRPLLAHIVPMSAVGLFSWKSTPQMIWPWPGCLRSS
jgi:hypothetical protein